MCPLVFPFPGHMLDLHFLLLQLTFSCFPLKKKTLRRKQMTNDSFFLSFLSFVINVFFCLLLKERKGTHCKRKWKKKTMIACSFSFDGDQFSFSFFSFTIVGPQERRDRYKEVRKRQTHMIDHQVGNISCIMCGLFLFLMYDLNSFLFKKKSYRCDRWSIDRPSGLDHMTITHTLLLEGHNPRSHTFLLSCCKGLSKATRKKNGDRGQRSLISSSIKILSRSRLFLLLCERENLGDEIIRLWIVSQHWRLDSWKDECYPDQAFMV